MNKIEYAIRKCRKIGLGVNKLVINEWNISNVDVRRHGLITWSDYMRMFNQQQIEMGHHGKHELGVWLRWLNQETPYRNDDKLVYACFGSYEQLVRWEFRSCAFDLIDEVFGEVNFDLSELSEVIYDAYGRNTKTYELNLPEKSEQRHELERSVWDFELEFKSDVKDFFCVERTKAYKSFDCTFGYRNAEVLRKLKIRDTPEILNELEENKTVLEDDVVHNIERWKTEYLKEV